MQRISSFLSLGMVLVLALVACGQDTPEATQTAIPTGTLIPTATLTATPATPLAILVLPTDLDQASYDLYQTTVYDLAQQAGFRFQVRNTLSELDLEPSLRVVVALPPDPGPGIAALAAKAPQTQFLAINIPDISAGGNISVLASTAQAEVVAFMSGYIGAMITEEYRIGMIGPQDDPEALTVLDAYANGMKYFCGTCKKFYLYRDEFGNPIEFPQYISIPTDEDPANYGGYAVYLIQRRSVEFIYVYPGIATPDLLAYIGSSGGVQMGPAPQNEIPLYWVASLSPDIVGAIREAWPILISGQGGQVIQSPLALTDVDPNLLSPGKQAQAEQVLAELLAGRISPQSVP